MPIQVLDPKVVAQIAAGEVVERPASVVKELVENALDAGASQISVEAGAGGVSLIRVTDNGSGIPVGEVELAFERHATSKLRKLDDLQSIASLGFRGEALPSIAAVADVEMTTCAEGESAGTYLRLENGAIGERRSQGRPRGTTITVRGLFRRVPARLKFLKSTATENSHIAGVVSQYALAYPEVAFSLVADGKPVLRTPGNGRLMDSVVEAYGTEVARHMLEVRGEAGGWEASAKVSGLAGAPVIARSSRDYLSFFVNRRWVSSRLLAWAVTEAYHGLLMTGKYPVAIINITLPPSEVDVNIHPAKTEVKFRNEHQVFMTVQKAVRETLVAQATVTRIEEPTVTLEVPGLERTPLRSAPVAAKHPEMEAGPTLLTSLPVLRVLGQALSCYIVAEGPDGVYLIDQHAAHERVLFEKVVAQRARQAVEVQGLLEPVSLELSPKQAACVELRREALTDFGFSIEPFGERSYLVRTVPAVLAARDWTAALREVLELPEEGNTTWLEKMSALLACHGAIRAGQVLEIEEMRALVRQLEQATLPHSCPHGRPTLIHLSSGQIRREFGRT